MYSQLKTMKKLGSLSFFFQPQYKLDSLIESTPTTRVEEGQILHFDLVLCNMKG